MRGPYKNTPYTKQIIVKQITGFNNFRRPTLQQQSAAIAITRARRSTLQQRSAATITTQATSLKQRATSNTATTKRRNRNYAGDWLEATWNAQHCNNASAATTNTQALPQRQLKKKTCCKCPMSYYHVIYYNRKFSDYANSCLVQCFQ